MWLLLYLSVLLYHRFKEHHRLHANVLIPSYFVFMLIVQGIYLFNIFYCIDTSSCHMNTYKFITAFGVSVYDCYQ